MTQQLPLALPVQESRDRQDFIVTPANALALAALDGWQDWPEGKMLLCGPPGTGKSHLAAIWAKASCALTLEGRSLDAQTPARLAALPAPLLLIEDAEEVAGNPEAETALFHLHNLARDGGRLLLTAASPPRDWGLRLPDLLSRMQAAALTRLEAPDDALLFGVLTKLFADRQLAVPPALIPYLLARMPRSIGAARALVAELDSRALAERRPIGLRLAAEVLDGTEDASAEDIKSL